MRKLDEKHKKPCQFSAFWRQDGQGFYIGYNNGLMQLRPEFPVGFNHVIQDFLGNQKTGNGF